jgi:hypothetical protein
MIAWFKEFDMIDRIIIVGTFFAAPVLFFVGWGIYCIVR